MPKPAKAIVVVRIASQLRQILSIEERATGDLTIVLKRGLRSETLDGVDRGDIQQRKISIHRSPASDSINIVHTEVIGGVNRRSYAQIRPNKVYGEGIMWPVYAWRSSNLPEAAYTPKIKSADRVFDLGNFNDKKWSLLLIMTVRTPNTNFSSHWACNRVPVYFSHFIIDLLWTFVRLPTNHLGDYLAFVTKPLIIDGVKQEGFDVIDAKSPTPYRFEEIQEIALGHLASNAMRKIVRIAREAGEVVSNEEEDRLAAAPFLFSGTMEEI